MDAVISKAQLSRQLGVSRAAVTSYVRRDMPVNFDGKLNSAAALAWVNNHVEPHHADRGAAVAAEAPEANPRGNPRVFDPGAGTGAAATTARPSRPSAPAWPAPRPTCRR